jgi:hypothetical protein
MEHDTPRSGFTVDAPSSPPATLTLLRPARIPRRARVTAFPDVTVDDTIAIARATTISLARRGQIDRIDQIYLKIPRRDVDVVRSFVRSFVRPPFDPTLARSRTDPIRSNVRRSRSPRVDVCRRVARARRPARPSTPCAPGGLVYES